MRLTIVTVTFRNLSGLKATEASIPFRDIDGVEWVVVDGGSDDGTAAYLEQLDLPVLKFVSEPDKGIFDAMNKGIAMSSGEFVIFMNAGDCFATPDVVNRVVAQLSKGSCDLLYGDSYEADGENDYAKRARSPAWNIYSMFTHHQSIIYRRSMIADGYDLSYKLSGDWALTSRLLRQKHARAEKFDGYICRFERGGVSQSGRHRDVFNREHWRILREESRLPLLLAGLSYGIKRCANAARSTVPGFYDLVRFKRS